MTKFFGKIGYAMTQETKPGVWMDQIMEREYYGDLLRNSYRFQTSDKVNDDVSIANEFSIIADSFAKDNFHLMKSKKADFNKLQPFNTLHLFLLV